jgi:hypothetical protein
MAGALFGVGEFSFLSGLPRLSASEAILDPKAVRFDSEIEPLVRCLEETPRERLLEEVALRVQHGLSYRELLTALVLAGVRNIQPRPVGFKFHAVLVINSAHLASQSSPDSDRWLPIFWALDAFKSAQAQDVREGDWTMAPVTPGAVPASHRAKSAFVEAMDRWDEAGADAAVAGLARCAGAQELFEMFARYGARDFRDIGHKAIYVANSWRTLQVIGWQHAEPVLRSLAYALLAHEGRSPAERDAPADRSWRYNHQLAVKIRPDWLDGKATMAATAELLDVLRHASAEDACKKVVAVLNAGVAVQSIWDALFQGAGELLMRRPGILSLHAVTTTNALHFAFQASAIDETRRLLVLQNTAFLTFFRGDDALRDFRLDQLQPATEEKGATIEEVFQEVSKDRMAAARKVLQYLKAQPEPGEFIRAARRLIFLKGTNSHDYKFSSAVLEDFRHVSVPCRNRFLAASVFNLRGTGDPENELVKRTRAALNA